MTRTLFVSHGAPNLGLVEAPARRFLESLGPEIGHPKAILVATAHWESETPLLSRVARNGTIYDFRGFAPELQKMTYPAPGSPALADAAAALLNESGLDARAVAREGLDHGVWVPLRLIRPEADIPVVQLSVQPRRDASHHFKIGRALAPLAREGVLIMGSGSFTHDLSEFRGQTLDAPTPAWVTDFAAWMEEAIAAGDVESLLNYRVRAPFAAKNHPTEEHLHPLFVALGAAGETAANAQLHASSTYGILRMDAYAFGEERRAA